MKFKTHEIPCPSCEGRITILAIGRKLYVGDLRPLGDFDGHEKPAPKRAKKKETRACKKCGRVFFSWRGINGHQARGACKGTGEE